MNLVRLKSDLEVIYRIVCLWVLKKLFKLATDSDSKSNMASSGRIIQTNSAWFQKKINLRPQHRGVHLVTEEILRQIPELSQFAMGLCHVQSEFTLTFLFVHVITNVFAGFYGVLLTVLHTSASLALNESWDPDVRDDMEMMLNKIVPEGLAYRHSCEGPDDMVSKHTFAFILRQWIHLTWIIIYFTESVWSPRWNPKGFAFGNVPFSWNNNIYCIG